MSDLIGTVWQSKRNRRRWVRVVEHGDQLALVHACTVEGRTLMVMRGGGLHAQPSHIRLSGGRLQGYEQVTA